MNLDIRYHMNKILVGIEDKLKGNQNKMIINRNNIYLGVLIRPLAYRESIVKKLNVGIVTENDLERITELRSILYQINQQGYGKDLRYTSNPYAITNVTKQTVDPDYIIQNNIHLEPLLKELGYSDVLTQGEVNQLYTRIIYGMTQLRIERKNYSGEVQNIILHMIPIKKGIPNPEEKGYGFGIKRR